MNSPFFDENLVIEDKYKLQNELKKYYALPANEKHFPDDAYLLLAGILKAQKVDIINKHQARINIWQREMFRGYVNMHLQMSYEVIRKGSILCTGVSSCQTLAYKDEYRVINTFGNLFKIITMAVENTSCVQIRCRKLVIESIGNYVLHAGSMVTHKEFLKMVSGMKA